MKKLISSLLVLVVISSVSAQESVSPILLENFRITLSEQEWKHQSNEVVDGRIYRIVNDAPSLKLNKNFSGIEVLEYLPKRAFIVSINTNNIEEAKAFLNRDGATAVLNIRPEWKMSTNMFKENIPDWAWLDNIHFKATVAYYKDLDGSIVVNSLKAQGYTVLTHFEVDKVLEISITPEQIREIASLPYVAYIEEMDKPGEPENFTARTNHRVNYLQAQFPGSVNFDGTGITVGHGDDGALGEHVDFRGRVSGLLGNNSGDHGDHVAGTIFGAGNKDPRKRGMAPGAEILYSDYPDNLQFADNNFANSGVVITSSSYSNGCGAGYTNNPVTGSRTMDMDVMQNPPLMHVFSAGNSGTSSCGYGTPGTSGGVSGWGNITGGHKVAKNVVTVANLSLVDALAGSSSRGPAADGRIKPDISAVGTSVESTTDLPVPNSYTTKSGTSMACPGVSGTMATLYQAYRQYNNGQNPESALIKGIALNTADDLGNPGPDFKFGYGRINARRAHEVLASGNWLVDSIGSGSNTHIITVPGGDIAEVRVMLIWADPPTFPSAGPDLVNDLDLDVTQGTSSFDPWVCNPFPSAFTLDQNAVRGRDSLNNMEQVTFTNPGSGDLTVDVSAFNVPSGTQKYYIIYEFVKDEIVVTFPVGGEGFSPSQNEYVRWDAPGTSGNFRVEYSLDGNNWTLINSNVSASARYLNWNVPNVTTDQARIRVIRGQDTAVTPGTFVIANDPTNFSILSSCPDSLTLSWDAVSGVSGYNVYALGAKYMDSIGYTTDTFFVVSPSNPNSTDEWYSVASVVNGKAGQRLIAIQKSAGTFNCQLSKDLLASELISPLPGVIPNCFPTNNVPVKVRLTNNGLNDIYGFNASYQFNGGAPVNTTANDTILVGQSIVYEFPGSSLNLNVGNTYDLDVWVDYTNDQNAYNDTISEVLIVTTGNLKFMPYFNDFEGFNTCSTNDNCGGTNCTLNDGWRNLTNGLNDDIDFRVDQGGTPSSGTGPSIDFNPGTSTGKYAYLEASSGCDSAEAILLSPCLLVDTSAGQPMVEFAYHMAGVDMGVLNVDLVTESGIVYKVIPQISGNQGVQWLTKQIDLSPWKGQTVVVRFRGKTGFGFRSDLAIDDFKFFENGVAAPVAGFNNNAASGTCTGDTVTFTSTSTGNITGYNWDFGNGAVPATATTAGPHKVVYNIGGTKQVSLDVSNSGGISTSNTSISIDDVPATSFIFSISNLTVNFTDGSSFNPTSWSWDFGDGATSTQQNPSHTYTTGGSYPVKLTASNNCGSRDYIDTLRISGIGLEETSLNAIALYPNPARGKISVSVPSDLKVTSVVINDLSGKMIATSLQNGTSELIELNVNNLARGVYIVDVHTSAGLRSFKVILE